MATSPELFNGVELLVSLPQCHLEPGARGTVVETYPGARCEVEFAGSDGKTRALVALAAEQVTVIWRASTQTWMPTAGEASARCRN